MVKVSVVVPVYNGGEAFGRCLAALATTTYPRMEVVVVDDGSTDGSSGRVADHGFRLLHTDRARSGPATARNLGARAATGDVLFFVDADVLVQPDTVAQVAGVFADDPGLDALFGSYDDQPDATNFLSQYKNLFHHYVHQHGQERASTFWSGCGAMRRAVFLSHGGFDTDLYDRPCIEDIELGSRVTRGGGRIHLLKSLQVKHLKRWTARSLLRSDIFDRGIPWTRLLLREKAFANDLNLQTHNRVSVVAVYLLVLSLLAGLVVPRTLLLGLALAGALLVLNWPLYRWFAHKRGWLFTLAVIPWHWFYYLYNGMSFAVGLALHLAAGGSTPARSSVDATMVPAGRPAPNQRPWQRALIRLASLKPATWFFRQFLHRLDRLLLRLTGGALSASAPFTGLPTANVTTTGAKSGLPRTVPLVVVTDGENLAVVASNYGRASYPAWYFNLRANPKATVVLNGRSDTYLAREADEEERARLWPQFVALYPGYAAYAQRAAHREIPMLVLTPKECP